MERRVRTLAVALLVLVALVGVGLALTGGVAVDGTIPLDDDDAPQVDVVTSNSEMLLDGEHGGTGTMEIVTEQGTIVFDGPDGTAAQVHEDDITGEYTSVTQIDAGSGLTITPEDKPAVTVGGGIDSVEFASMAVDDNTRDFTYTASSEASVTVNEIGATSETVVAVASDGTVLDQTTVDSSGSATFSELDSGSYDIQIATTSDPALGGASPSNNTNVSETPVQLSIDVTDGDFGAVQGDNVTVEFIDDSDGSTIGEDTLTSNGTATTNWNDGVVGGENNWHVEVSDAYGNSVQSETFSFLAPDELYIRNELSGDLLTDTASNVTLTFYGETTTERRTTQDGTVPLAGLPVNEELVVVAEADGYYNRRIILDSLTEQQNVYLLNESVESVEVIFTIEDRSGNFDAEDSKLYLEKAVPTENGTTETRIIAGDYFGLGRFPVVLEQDSRYDLRVENREGQVYDPGTYTASIADIETINIGSIEFAPPDTESYSVQSDVVDDEQIGDRLDFRFTDPAEETTDFEVRVFPRSDPENATYEDSWTGPRGNYTFSSSLNESETYMIEWSATRNGNEIGQRLPVGGSSIIPVPIGSEWLNGFSFVAVVFVASLGSPRYGSTVAMAAVGMAGMFILIGWLSVSTVAWWVAAAIAVGAHLRGGR